MIYSPPQCRWRGRWSFVVHKTFLKLHSERALQRSPKQLKELQLKGLHTARLAGSNRLQALRSKVDFKALDHARTSGMEPYFAFFSGCFLDFQTIFELFPLVGIKEIQETPRQAILRAWKLVMYPVWNLASGDKPDHAVPLGSAEHHNNFWFIVLAHNGAFGSWRDW